MMSLHRTLMFASAWLMSVSGAAAHPHIFITTGVEVQFNSDGFADALRIVWAYDDFYSLSTLTDMGLDPDADGVLTTSELATLNGFDMRWIAGFEGDSYLEQQGRAAMLSGPQQPTASVIGGHIVTTHVRRLSAPLDPANGPLMIRIYDPTYYTAYDIAMPVLFTTRNDCDAALLLPDETVANKALAAALAALGPTQTLEDAGVDTAAAIGGIFAQQVVVTCGP